MPKSDFSNDNPGKQRVLPMAVLPPSNPNGIRDVSPEWWFSPLQPVLPLAPGGYRPRQFAYQPGANIIWQPKGDEPISFEVLRYLADAWDILRIALEMKKDQLCGVEFEIRPKKKTGEKGKDYKQRAATDAGAIALNKFFEKPDGFHTWNQWLRMWVEDMLVCDAVALYLARDAQGKVATVHPLDGATINRMLTEQGITPQPPSTAYQQVVYGSPVFNMTTNDMVYAMSNERTHKRYGFSVVERILLTITFGLRRQEWVISEYTSGSMPEAMVFLPADLTIEQVEEIQGYFDSLLAGETAERRKVRFMPGYGTGDNARPNVIFPKEPLLKDDLDTWLAQVVCAALGISATAFQRQMNRASSEEANDAARTEGLKSDVEFVEDVVNTVIEKMGMADDYECASKQHRDVDALKQAQVDTALEGKYTVNELREARGDDPFPGKNAGRLGKFGGTGWVPLDPEPGEVIPGQQPPPAPGGGAPGQIAPKPGAPAVPGAKPQAALPAAGKQPVPGATATPKKKVADGDLQKLEAGDLEKYSFGSTQVDIEPMSDVGVRMADFQNAIPVSALLEKGVEDDRHITVRYGIQGEDTGAISDYLATLEPFEVTFGLVRVFPPKEQTDWASVLYVEVFSPDLEDINAALEARGDWKPADFEYHPHATLAYVDPQYAPQHVADDRFLGMTMTARAIAIMPRVGEPEVVPLGGDVEKLAKEFDSNQPRDEQGRWGEGDGGTKAESPSAEYTRVISQTYLHHDGTYNDAVIKSFNDLREKQGTKLDENESAAETMYVSTDYTINDYLRDKDNAGFLRAGLVKEVGKPLEDAILRSPLPEDVVLFRGALLSNNSVATLKPGSTVTDKGFTSTSMHLGRALEFSVGSTGTNAVRTAVVFRIAASKGSPGLVTSNDNEREVILAPGGRYKITSVEKVAASMHASESPGPGWRGLVVNAKYVPPKASARAFKAQMAAMRKMAEAAGGGPSADRFGWLDGDFEIEESEPEANEPLDEPFDPNVVKLAKGAPDQPRDEKGQFAGEGGDQTPARYGKNPKGQKVPIYTATDLARMGAARRDATLHEIWPTSGKPGPNVFYFEMTGGDQRPSVLVPAKKLTKYSADQERVPAGEPGGGQFGGSGAGAGGFHPMQSGQPKNIRATGYGEGRSAKTLSAKALRAQQTSTLTDKPVQFIAKQSEKILCRAIGVDNQWDNSPFDAQSDAMRVGLELKCMTTNKQGKLRVQDSAGENKIREMVNGKLRVFTVIVDRREAYAKATDEQRSTGKINMNHATYYIRKGFGGYRIETMTKTTIGDIRKITRGQMSARGVAAAGGKWAENYPKLFART